MTGADLERVSRHAAVATEGCKWVGGRRFRLRPCLRTAGDRGRSAVQLIRNDGVNRSRCDFSAYHKLVSQYGVSSNHPTITGAEIAA